MESIKQLESLQKKFASHSEWFSIIIEGPGHDWCLNLIEAFLGPMFSNISPRLAYEYRARPSDDVISIRECRNLLSRATKRLKSPEQKLIRMLDYWFLIPLQSQTKQHCDQKLLIELRCTISIKRVECSISSKNRLVNHSVRMFLLICIPTINILHRQSLSRVEKLFCRRF